METSPPALDVLTFMPSGPKSSMEAAGASPSSISASEPMPSRVGSCWRDLIVQVSKSSFVKLRDVGSLAGWALPDMGSFPARSRVKGSGDASPESASTSGLSEVRLYETRRGFHLAGGRRTSADGERAVAGGSNRPDGDRIGGLDAVEDPLTYDDDALERLLQRDSPGFVTLVAEGVAVVGTMRLLTGHHLLLVTARRALGLVCGHVVWGVGDTKLVRLADTVDRRGTKADEQRLKRLLQWVDLATGFFWSDTYNLTETLQTNALSPLSGERHPGHPVYCPGDFESAFAWNAHLSRALRVALGTETASRWIAPLCHGYFAQTRASMSGREVTMTVVARRSRHHAGTRFNRRGVNARGRVANEVETEQIVDAGDAQLTWLDAGTHHLITGSN